MMTEQRPTLKGIMNRLEGVELRDRHGRKFYYPLRLTKQMRETPLEALELSVRSFNCLKRAGYSTVGELVDSISEGKELRSIRNCGARSVREIMEQLFLFQYTSLKTEKRDAYLAEVVRMNLEKQE